MLVVSHLLARLCVRLLEGSVQSCFFLWLKLHFLGFTVLPWPATVLPQGHGTNATSTAVFFYCRWWSSTTAHGAVLPPGRYYRNESWYYRGVASAWGLRADRGSSNSSIPIHSFSRRLSLSPAHERRWRPSLDLPLQLLSSDFDQWDRSPPLPLAMEQGLSPNPSLFGLFLCF